MEQWRHEMQAKQMIKKGKPASAIARVTGLDITWVKLQMQAMGK